MNEWISELPGPGVIILVFVHERFVNNYFWELFQLSFKDTSVGESANWSVLAWSAKTFIHYMAYCKDLRLRREESNTPVASAFYIKPETSRRFNIHKGSFTG